MQIVYLWKFLWRQVRYMDHIVCAKTKFHFSIKLLSHMLILTFCQKYLNFYILYELLNVIHNFLRSFLSLKDMYSRAEKSIHMSLVCFLINFPTSKTNMDKGYFPIRWYSCKNRDCLTFTGSMTIIMEKSVLIPPPKKE